MNKQILFSTLLLFFFSGAGFSQIHIGVYGGLNNSKLAGDAPPFASYKSLPGLSAGLKFDVNLSSSVRLSIQPSFAQEGTKVFYQVATQEDPVDSIRIRLNYFSVPLLLEINSTSKHFYAIGGFEAGVLLNSKMQISGNEQNFKEPIAQLNIAMQFGAGYRIPIGPGHLIIEIRYAQGLVNLTDEAPESTVIPRVKTSGMKIFTGFEIPLAKK